MVSESSIIIPEHNSNQCAVYWILNSADNCFFCYECHVCLLWFSFLRLFDELSWHSRLCAKYPPVVALLPPPQRNTIEGLPGSLTYTSKDEEKREKNYALFLQRYLSNTLDPHGPLIQRASPFGLISEERSCDFVHFLFNNCSEIPYRSRDICTNKF